MKQIFAVGRSARALAMCGASAVSIICATQATAQQSGFSGEAWAAGVSDPYLYQRERLGTDNRAEAGVALRFANGGFSSQVNLNVDDDLELNYDGSFVEYSVGNATFGVGAVERNWSFSRRTSLILSKNARPMPSAYIKLGSDEAPANSVLSWVGPWSFEFFNGWTESTVNPADSKVMGMRLTLEPIRGLELEFVRTAHWGGQGFDNGFTGFRNALFNNTNVGAAANVDQLAGFGLSYTLPEEVAPIRIYGQLIGEDEAAGLPYCFINLGGAEWSGAIGGRNTVLGVEYIDTRASRSPGGFCAPNTAYNNNTYKYTNYDTVMGAPIDSEGRSLEIFGETQLSSELSMDYSVGHVLINGTGLATHRLSSTRQEGWTGSLGMTWERNDLSISGTVNYQSFDLDNAAIPSGVSLGLMASRKF